MLVKLEGRVERGVTLTMALIYGWIYSCSVLSRTHTVPIMTASPKYMAILTPYAMTSR